MSDADDRSLEFCIWLVEYARRHPAARQAPQVLNCAGVAPFTVLFPDAEAHTFGRRDDMLRVAELLGAFEAGDVGRAAVLMGIPPPGMS